jgi:VWFA-related protein
VIRGVLQAALWLGQAPQVPTFQVGVETVYLDVFVTRSGAPVTGLSAADFEVTDNGVRQRVRLEALESRPLQAILVFDMSESVAGEKLQRLQAAGHAFLRGLRPGETAALLAFSHRLTLTEPTADLAGLHQALDRLAVGGSTSVIDALYAALRVGSTLGRPLIVVFSDGADNLSWRGAQDVAALAETSDALVYMVGVDPRPTIDGAVPAGPPPEDSDDLRVLGRIAEATGGRYWRADRTADLEPSFLRILAEVRTRYLLAYEPAGVAREGRHVLKVKLRGGKGTARARSGYRIAPAREEAPARPVKR